MSRSCRGSRLAFGTAGTFSMNFSFGLSGSVMPAGRGNGRIIAEVGGEGTDNSLRHHRQTRGPALTTVVRGQHELLKACPGDGAAAEA